MTHSARQMAYAADPDWYRKAFQRWYAELPEEPEPPPPPLRGMALVEEMASLLGWCQAFLEGFEDDPNQEGVADTLQRIRALPI